MKEDLDFAEQVRVLSEISALVFDHDFEMAIYNFNKERGEYECLRPSILTPRVRLMHCRVLNPDLMREKERAMKDTDNWRSIPGDRFSRRLKPEIQEAFADADTDLTATGRTPVEALASLFAKVSAPGSIVQRDDDPEAAALCSVTRYKLTPENKWEHLP